MPSIVAGHLGLKGVVVSGEGTVDAKIKTFEKQPRGGLGTFAKLDGSNSWLRQRNSLLKDFGRDGQPRVMICEGQSCREEGLDAEVAKEPDLGGLTDILPEKPLDQTATELEKESQGASISILPGKENAASL